MGIEGDNVFTGVFSFILKRMVESCCQFCHSHNTSNLDMLSKNTGTKNDTEFLKTRSLQDVKNNISENSDFSFPLYGHSEQVKYGSSLYGFIPLVSSPGDALIVNRDSPGDDAVGAAVIKNWPLVFLLFVFSTIAGIIMWTLVSITCLS